MYEMDNGERCPECQGEVAWEFECPRWKNHAGMIMSCMGCSNAVRFVCVAKDEYGDLVDGLGGCGWWFQSPLHPESSAYKSMGREPEWDYQSYIL